MGIRLVLDESLFDHGEDTTELEVQGKTIGECLENAFARQPLFRDLIFREDGQLIYNTYFRLNSQYLYPDNPLDVLIKPVQDADEIGISTSGGG